VNSEREKREKKKREEREEKDEEGEKNSESSRFNFFYIFFVCKIDESLMFEREYGIRAVAAAAAVSEKRERAAKGRLL
jgi:hypothetical protein